jgi:hypothetical protein
VTPAQQKHIRRMIRAWGQRLAMEHWDFEIAWEEEPDNDDAYASIEVSDLYDTATIRFRQDFGEHDLFEKNRIVVHELLHALFRDYGVSVRSIGVTGALSSDARALWWDRCHDTEEALIDRLANRLVEIGGEVK